MSASPETARAMPMFPLGGVLLPSTAIALHIFEPRYRAMARHCVDGDGQLGVVLIERGSEVGGGDVRFDVGTRARVAEAVELADGRWAIAVVGEDRIRIRRWLDEDPYPRAEVVACVDRPAGAGAAARRNVLDGLLHRIVAMRSELGEPATDGAVELDPDPAVATWQAVALGPLGPMDAQRILSTDGVDERLDLVLALLGEEASVLAQRLAGG